MQRKEGARHDSAAQLDLVPACMQKCDNPGTPCILSASAHPRDVCEAGRKNDREGGRGREGGRRGGQQASPAAAARSAVTALVVRGRGRVDTGEARSEEDDAGCRISERTRLALDDDMSKRTDTEKRGEDDGMMEGRRLTTRARGKSQHTTN